jgi:hypothetical protein
VTFPPKAIVMKLKEEGCGTSTFLLFYACCITSSTIGIVVFYLILAQVKALEIDLIGV